MSIRRHGHTLIEMGNGVAVILADGSRQFVINAKMPDDKDYRAQDKIIEAASKPNERDRAFAEKIAPDLARSLE